jgi:hypothetical protein
MPIYERNFPLFSFNPCSIISYFSAAFFPILLLPFSHPSTSYSSLPLSSSFLYVYSPAILWLDPFFLVSYAVCIFTSFHFQTFLTIFLLFSPLPFHSPPSIPDKYKFSFLRIPPPPPPPGRGNPIKGITIKNANHQGKLHLGTRKGIHLQS